jgi:hypothetical protein
MIRNNRRNFLGLAVMQSGLGAFLVLGLAGTALAETFSIDGTALNTNAQFPLKDGHPIVSTWPLNNSDNDQQFDRLAGNLLKHRSTGKCLNAYQPASGSTVNVYPCNTNDSDQKFTFVSVGGNTNLIQRAGTNLCLNMANRNSYQRILLQNCNSSNANQRFVSNAGASTSGVRNSKRKIDAFASQFTGVTGITRYDTKSYDGQCVTLIARYLQEHYGASRTSLSLDNGGGTATAVANQFSSSFLPTKDPADPIPGSVISFPNAPYSSGYGHVALVISAQRSGSSLILSILDSNGDGRAPNTKVTQRSVTINTTNYSATGYGGRIYWTNPKD